MQNSFGFMRNFIDWWLVKIHFIKIKMTKFTLKDRNIPNEDAI